MITHFLNLIYRKWAFSLLQRNFSVSYDFSSKGEEILMHVAYKIVELEAKSEL